MNQRNANTTRNTFVALLTGLLSVGVIACVPAGDGAVVTGDDFADSIPSEEMLALELDDDVAAQGLTVTGQGLEGEKSDIRTQANRLIDGLNALRARTHERIETMREGEATERTIDGLTCKRWETDGELNHWRLTSCRVDERAKRFGFKLEGKPLADADADYLTVFAGRGVKLESVEGKRRGKGQAGYNFDNIATLTGKDVAGKIGIGYRANGKARQMNIGLRGVQGPQMENPHSGLYQFKHIKGKGGGFRFMTMADIAAPDADGQMGRGQDGVNERIRAGVKWHKSGAARTAYNVCGGSLGAGNCFHTHQCWTADGTVTFEDVLDRDSDLSWEETECPNIDELPDAPTADDEAALPEPAEGDDDAGAPVMAEPFQIDEE